MYLGHFCLYIVLQLNKGIQQQIQIFNNYELLQVSIVVFKCWNIK